MSLALAALLILAGVVVLLIGGDYLVRGATALARKAKIPPLLVGLTIVAFGTSAPELIVSIDAAVSGAPGLALGNIVGSNTANVLLVLGLPALFGAIATKMPGSRRNAVFALLAGVILVAVSWDRTIGVWEGVILLGLIVAFTAYLGVMAARGDADPLAAELKDVDNIEGLPKSGAAIALALIVGLIALPAGARMIVTGGIDAAQILGVDESVIGLTALAIGTSLPELATVIIAVMRRESDLAIGNILGSNVFNVFAVGGAMGVAAGLSGNTLSVGGQFMAFDFWVMLAASLVLMLLVFAGRPIGRLTGAVLFGAYIAYIAALAWMNLPG